MKGNGLVTIAKDNVLPALTAGARAAGMHYFLPEDGHKPQMQLVRFLWGGLRFGMPTDHRSTIEWIEMAADGSVSFGRYENFYGTKAGLEPALRAMAPFIEPGGTLEFRSEEDGVHTHWRWHFDGKAMRGERAVETWVSDEEPMT